MTLTLPKAAAAALFLSVCPALAQHAGHTMPMPMSTPTAATKAAGKLPLTVHGATIAAVPPTIGDTAAFATLTNTSAKPIKLTGVTTPITAHAMLMNTVRDGKMMGMKMTPALVVPARGKLTLRRDGDHLMLMGLKRPLKVGESIGLTLKAADGRTFTFSATVRKP